jgi:predicted nucleic acid-binding protein
MRGAFQARGRTRSVQDMLIAATAQVHQLVLVTRNVRDFEDCALTLLNPID